MVTQDDLAQLRAARRTPHATLELTPGGAVTNYVHQNLDREREQKIAHGEYSLQNAERGLVGGFCFSSRQGLAKAQFNHSSGGLKP
jgi:hypothetical protein